MKEQVLISKDEPGFYKKAAQIFIETAAAAIRDRGRYVVALSGGSTPKKFFAQLLDPYFKDRVDWPKVVFIWGDERCVPANHADSNYKLAHDLLLSKLPVGPDHILRMPGEMNPQEGAKAYEQTLRILFNEAGHITGTPQAKIDFNLMGVGEDGHTASLFPGTTALRELQRWVVPNYVERLKSNRLTLTFPVINASRLVLFLVAGQNKAAIMKEVLRDDLPKNRYPSQGVHPVGGELIWLLDQGAASALPNTIRHAAYHLP